VAALRRAGPRPFDIEIGFLSSFSSAPFLHVLDADAGIAALRPCLAPANCGEQPVDYTAHVTVGLYNGAWPSAQVSQRLAAFPCGPATRHKVDRISLMSYAAGDIGGPLTTQAVYHFDSAAIVWHAAPPF
jgi:2'-5' RNA ligase